MGLSAELNIQESALRLWLTGPIRSNILVLQLAHPMEADRDFTVSLGRRTDGSYSAPLPSSVAAHWHWTLDSGEDSDWRLDGSLTERNFESSGAF